MSRHRQTHLELNPGQPASPPTWALILGALCALVSLWFITIVLFSL